MQQAAKAGSSCPCDFFDADVIRGSEEQMPRLLSMQGIQRTSCRVAQGGVKTFLSQIDR